MNFLPKQIPTWILASCFKHFYVQRGTVDMFIEGQTRNTSKLREWFEFRLDGPFCQFKTNDNVRLDVEINILVSSTLDDLNAYRNRALTALVQSMFTNCIVIKRYGDIADDALNDDKQIGLLALQMGRREEISATYFGKIRPDTDLEQSTVEGHYRCYLSLQEALNGA